MMCKLLDKKLIVFFLLFSIYSATYAAPSDQDFTALGNAVQADPFTLDGLVYTLSSPTSTDSKIVSFADNTNFAIAANVSDRILIFNTNSNGSIAHALGGLADFRITTTDASEFKIVSMQTDMSSQQVDDDYIKTITVSGYRDTILITQDSISFASSDSTGSINYNKLNNFGGTLTFDSNWKNIDEIRFTTTDATKIPILGIDALDFEAAISAKAEPTNHPTAFIATTNSTSQITTAWTDATGAVTPDSYLVMCSTSNAFTAPTDGAAQTNDSDCSDSGGVQNIAHGVGTVAWTGLTAGTQYYYKIFPYTNTGSDVNYKTDATPATANATTTVVLNSDATLTPSSGISEPIDLPTTANATTDAVNLFDFILTDGGGGDGLSTDVTQLVLHTSGTGDFSKVTWRLSGTNVSQVVGVYNLADNTLTFSGLGISIADGMNETYIVNGFFNDNSSITDNHTYLFSIDGASDAAGGSDVTVDPNKTQMAADGTPA
jgi:hypothetical protein